MTGNDISEKLLESIKSTLQAGSILNTVSIYLLGYGDTGKTTLRTTIKNSISWSSKIGFDVRAETVVKNERTRGMEVDRRISFGDFNVIIVDFGGQHHYHSSTHLFTRVSRSVFLILANPFEEGFEEQLKYWLRLLVHKTYGEKDIPEAILVFSRKDDQESLEREKTDLESKSKSLMELASHLKNVFKEKINIASWVWMDCTRTKNPELPLFMDLLKNSIVSVMEKYKMVAPDVHIPMTILEAATEIFYERKELEKIICKAIKQDQETASNWVNTLLKSHDFFSVRPEGTKEVICTDLQRFGKDILAHLVEMKLDFQSLHLSFLATHLRTIK